MSRRARMRRPSPSLVISLLALFLALAGTTMAADGDNFLVGRSNSASSQTTLSAPVVGGKTLQVTNNDATNAASTALALTVAAGHAPLKVSSAARVQNLNADLLDGVDSSKFLHSSVPVSLTGASSSGVVNGTNTGGGNGLQGVTGSGTASGVYGQNDAGGFGLAGRSNQANGIGVFGEALGGGNAHAVSALSDGDGGAVIASNEGLGPALELHATGAPMSVDSATKVDNLNADEIDGLDVSQLVTGDPSPGAAARGGRIFANRIAPAVDGQRLLIIPGWGHLIVDKCDGSTGRLAFDANGTGNFDLMYSALYDDGPEEYSVITSLATTLTRFKGFVTMNIARDTWNSTKILTIWASWYSNGCRFQAQALESPQL